MASPAPANRKVRVAELYPNPTTSSLAPVRAYAKLAGYDWTYYVKSVYVIIGRAPAMETQEFTVDVDLGPAKNVSRKHAVLFFNTDSGIWQINVCGRNGIKIDNQLVKSPCVSLQSNNLLEIGGIQFLFILPTAEEQEKTTEPQYTSFPQEIDYSVHCVKPPLSYPALISEAINSSPCKELSLSNIYEYISKNYCFFQKTTQSWQNSIRHNLSSSNSFLKTEKKGIHGKGFLWRINPMEKKEKYPLLASRYSMLNAHYKHTTPVPNCSFCPKDSPYSSLSSFKMIPYLEPYLRQRQMMDTMKPFRSFYSLNHTTTDLNALPSSSSILRSMPPAFRTLHTMDSPVDLNVSYGSFSRHSVFPIIGCDLKKNK